MITAKWLSVLDHMHNKHQNFTSDEFTKCEHGEIEKEKEWFVAGEEQLLLEHTLLKPNHDNFI